MTPNRTTMRGILARLLRGWAAALDRQPDAPAPAARASDGPPPHWLDAARPTPPDHWLERVREHAPHLLDADNADAVGWTAAETSLPPGDDALPAPPAMRPVTQTATAPLRLEAIQTRVPAGPAAPQQVVSRTRGPATLHVVRGGEVPRVAPASQRSAPPRVPLTPARAPSDASEREPGTIASTILPVYSPARHWSGAGDVKPRVKSVRSAAGFELIGPKTLPVSVPQREVTALKVTASALHQVRPAEGRERVRETGRRSGWPSLPLRRILAALGAAPDLPEAPAHAAHAAPPPSPPQVTAAHFASESLSLDSHHFPALLDDDAPPPSFDARELFRRQRLDAEQEGRLWNG